MTATATHIQTVSTVGVPVSDQARAIDFYTRVLGLAVTRDVPFGQGQRWVEVGPPDGGTTIAIVPPLDGHVGVDTGIRLRTGDAAADHAALQAAGVDVDAELLRFPGVPPMFTLRDPDGNTLYVVEAM